MSKTKVFVQNQLLEKALAGYKPDFRYGERLQMFNHVYKVIAFQDAGYTFLQDEKNTPIAYPTNKLRMLMKKNFCRSLGMLNTVSAADGGVSAIDVSKAQISGPGSKVGVTPKAANAAQAKTPSTPVRDQHDRGQPVGTVKNGKDGDAYKKISSNPAVWVRMSTGSVHHEAGGEEQDPMSVSHETRAQFQRMMSGIDSKVHPDDRAKVQKKAQEWVQENAKFKHMQAGHNTNEVDHKGQSMPKTGIPSSTMANVHAQGDKARKVRQELIDMVKESHLKLKGGSDAK